MNQKAVEIRIGQATYVVEREFVGTVSREELIMNRMIDHYARDRGRSRTKRTTNMENLHFFQGDILSPNTTGHEIILCHQVNCKGVMGAGLARQLRSAFPGLYKAYRISCYKADSSKDLLGTVCYFNGRFNGYDFTIANLFSQHGYGRSRRHTDYADLRQALVNVRYVATPLPARALTTVRIPYKMGCGLAGGDWETVYQIILDELVSHDIPVEIWEKAI